MKKKLEEIKKEYAVFQKKYKLPGFSDLNREFDIEKIQEMETEFFLRAIRRIMVERTVSFLRFLEMFLNPTIAPVFVMSMIKKLNREDRVLIESAYKELISYELKSVERDINYDEKKEAELIKEISKKWSQIKGKLSKLVSNIEKTQEKTTEKKKNYFG